MAVRQPVNVDQNAQNARDVMQKIRGKLRKYTHLRPSVRNPHSINLGSGPSELDFGLRGPDVQTLFESANKMREWGSAKHAQSGVPGAVAVYLIFSVLRKNPPSLRATGFSAAWRYDASARHHAVALPLCRLIDCTGYERQKNRPH